MKKRIALILHDSFFKYLDAGNPKDYWHLSCDDISGIINRGIQYSGNEEFTYKYLFGNARYIGIIRDYLFSGYEVEIFEGKLFHFHSKEIIDRFDRFDFQFSAATAPAHIENILSKGKFISGWSPPHLGYKKNQALALDNIGLKPAILPKQIAIPSYEKLKSISKWEVSRWYSTDFLIAKAFRSSASTMPDNTNYLIFHKDSWDRFIDYAKDHTRWFYGFNGILISELIQTDDPYAGNNNAVFHKVYLPCGLPQAVFSNWSLKCHKISAKFHLDKIGNDIKEMREVFELQTWMEGDLESYRGILMRITDSYLQIPCLFGVDIVINPDGRLHILEFNKIAATFLDVFVGMSKSHLEEYMDIVKSDLLTVEYLQNCFDKFKGAIKIFPNVSEELQWIG